MRSSYAPELGGGPGPLFQRVADAIARDVRSGALVRGERLPGTRVLAERLQVDRTTVVRAYDELEAQGWVRAVPSGGTVVVGALPGPPAGPLVRPGSAVARPVLPVVWERPPDKHVSNDKIVMSGGTPDVRLVPAVEVARAYRAAASDPGCYGYVDPRGTAGVRAALAGWLAERRGVVVAADEVVVTRGAQQALFLVAMALLRPGDRVVVEAYGYAPAWQALRAAGATLVPAPVDRHGLDVAAVVAGPPPAAVYVTPHHQFPTGAVLPAERRELLLRWARRHRVFVLEDDYDHEFHYRGAPVRPLIAADRGGVVVSVGTLSKAVAPGLRLGWVIGPAAALERVVGVRGTVDRQGDPIGEEAARRLLEDGVIARHLRRAVRVYAGRQRLLVGALRERLGDRLRFDVPAGGLAMWVEAVGRDGAALAREAWARGVVVTPGQQHALDGRPDSFLRIGFASLDDAALLDGVARLARAFGSA